MRKRILAFIFTIALISTYFFPTMMFTSDALSSDIITSSEITTDEQVNYQKDSAQTVQTTAAYTLQDSTVYGSWSDSYLKYNCYAYALGRTDNCWPGRFSTIPNIDNFNEYASVYKLACDVKADLKSATFSNKCVNMTTTRPTSLKSGQSCICIRKSSDDYHLMKLSGSSWYHKPGLSNPLKYKYVPSTSRKWSDESSFLGVDYAPSTYYDSEIYFFIYSKEHGSIKSTWTGKDYHSQSRHYYLYSYDCSDCGEHIKTEWTSVPCSGPPCATPWSYSPKPEVV